MIMSSYTTFDYNSTLFLESVKDILHKVGLQEFKKYSNYSKGKLTTLTEKVVATDYGLKADIMTMISLKSNKPLFVIGKHFAPFETDYYISIMMIGNSDISKLKKNGPLWKIYKTFNLSEYSG